MKTLNKNLLENCSMNDAEMRVFKGGIIVDAIETKGKHGDGGCVKDVVSVHDDGRMEFDWCYIDCR